MKNKHLKKEKTLKKNTSFKSKVKKIFSKNGTSGEKTWLVVLLINFRIDFS